MTIKIGRPFVTRAILKDPHSKPPHQACKTHFVALKAFTTCKWRSTAAGQGKGWKPEAFGALAQHKKEVKDACLEEHQDNWSNVNLALKMLRDEAGPKEAQSPARSARLVRVKMMKNASHKCCMV